MTGIDFIKNQYGSDYVDFFTESLAYDKGRLDAIKELRDRFTKKQNNLACSNQEVYEVMDIFYDAEDTFESEIFKEIQKDYDN